MAIENQDLQESSRETRWNPLKSLFKREKKVSILVDGPNILRRVGNRQIKIEDIDQIGERLGSIRERIVYLNVHASDKLIEAMVNSGYNPQVIRDDIYVGMAMKAIEIANRGRTDILLIGSRDARVVPIIMKLKDKDIDTAIVGFDPGFSVALKNISDYAFELN
ncbi:MAG: NYN domain-containing protein [Candidatus Kariarchaeaceae archaeon]|jgi:uncharacterized protein (TIGR00288 family)